MDERTSEIIKECRAVLDAIENKTLPLSRAALKARGLAQLLKDVTAATWLNLECVGLDAATPPKRGWGSAPEAHRGFIKATLLRCIQEVGDVPIDELIAKSRDIPDRSPEKSSVLMYPLAVLETQAPLSAQEEARLMRERGGAEHVFRMRLLEREQRIVLERVAAAIHAWATNVYITHRFRQLAGNIFDRFKTQADVVLASVCPDAIREAEQRCREGQFRQSRGLGGGNDVVPSGAARLR